MEFALENTLIKDFDGQLWKQLKGIPMGDPHSSGMTIGACSWMEHEWMQTLDPATKDFFIARRYMDDILLFYAVNLSATSPHSSWRMLKTIHSLRLLLISHLRIKYDTG